MDPSWFLGFWLAQPFLQLLAPVIESVGFQNPLTLLLIAGYNSFSMTTLLMLTVIAYPVLRKKTWLLPFAVASVWLGVCGLFFLVFQQRYGLELASASMLPHAWLEFSAVFLWVARLRKACTLCQPIKWSAPDGKTWLQSLKKPEFFVSLLVADVRNTWKMTRSSFKCLATRQLWREFAVVLVLIFFAAVLETYLTPSITETVLG